jgi:hypothetical protein
MVLTLFIVPVVCALLARNAHSPQVVSKLLDRLTAQATSEAKPDRQPHVSNEAMGRAADVAQRDRWLADA